MCLHFFSHQSRGLFNSLHSFKKKLHFRTSLLTHEFHLYHDFIIHTFDPFAINYISTLKPSKQSRYFPCHAALPWKRSGFAARAGCHSLSRTRKHESDYLARSRSVPEKHFIVACCVLAGGRGHSFGLIFIYRFIYRV